MSWCSPAPRARGSSPSGVSSCAAWRRCRSATHRCPELTLRHSLQSTGPLLLLLGAGRCRVGAPAQRCRGALHPTDGPGRGSRPMGVGRSSRASGVGGSVVLRRAHRSFPNLWMAGRPPGARQLDRGGLVGAGGVDMVTQQPVRERPAQASRPVDRAARLRDRWSWPGLDDGRWRLTLACGLATMASALALSPLLDGGWWIVPTALVVAVVCGAGLLARSLRVPAPAQPLFSAAVLLVAPDGAVRAQRGGARAHPRACRDQPAAAAGAAGPRVRGGLRSSGRRGPRAAAADRRRDRADRPGGGHADLCPGPPRSHAAAPERTVPGPLGHRPRVRPGLDLPPRSPGLGRHPGDRAG